MASLDAVPEASVADPLPPGVCLELPTYVPTLLQGCCKE